MVPGAAHRVVHHEPCGERTAVVRADRTDGEQLIAAADEDQWFAVRMPEQDRAFRQARKGHTLREIRPFEFCFLLAHRPSIMQSVAARASAGALRQHSSPRPRTRGYSWSS